MIENAYSHTLKELSMKKLSIMIISLLVTAALVIGTPPAQAEPVKPASESPPRQITMKGRQYKAVKIGYQTQRANPHRWLNYKIAKNKFGPHTKWRRQYAAGWMISGFRVLKMSAKERRIVNRIKNRQTRAAGFDLEKAVNPMAARCTGSNGYLIKPGWRMQYHDYMNSCVTNRFKIALEATGLIIIGVLGGAAPTMRAKLWIGAVGAGLYVSGSWVRVAQANSSRNAVIIKHNMIYIPGGTKVWYTIASQ